MDSSYGNPPAKKQKSQHFNSSPKKCSGCGTLKSREFYSGKQWHKSAAVRKCKPCCLVASNQQARNSKPAGKETTRSCRTCNVTKPVDKAHFFHLQDSKCIPCLTQERETLNYRVNNRKCTSCEITKSKDQFSALQWITTQKCLECSDEIAELEQLEERCEVVEWELRRIYEETGIKEALLLHRENRAVSYDFRSFLERLECLEGSEALERSEKVQLQRSGTNQEPEEPLERIREAEVPTSWPFQAEKPASLAGTYDIVFGSFCAHGQPKTERTCRGTLVLREADGLLRGQVGLDSYSCLISDDEDPFHEWKHGFFIEERPARNEVEQEQEPTPVFWSALFATSTEESTLTDDGDSIDDDTKFTALRVFKEEVALPWLLHEGEDTEEGSAWRKSKKCCSDPITACPGCASIHLFRWTPNVYDTSINLYLTGGPSLRS